MVHVINLSSSQQNKELETSQQEAENRLADFSDEVELATLDKEMAEERLDQTEILMVGMKEELENLKVELSALKEIQGGSIFQGNPFLFPPHSWKILTTN